MIINFTDEELKKLHAIEDGYDKLLKDLEAKIRKLRPDEPDFDLFGREDIAKLEEQRPPAPPMPEPMEYRDDIDGRDHVPIYRKEDLEAYHKSPEYLAYIAENKRITDEIDTIYNTWLNAGSKKWREARDRYTELEHEKSQAIKDFIDKIEDERFNALSDTTAILEDAYNQVEQLIVNRYNYYDRMNQSGDFSARDVRALDDGRFRLDTAETKRIILGAIERHIKALPEDLKQDLDEYIERALLASPFVSDTGVLFALVKKRETQETTEKGLSAIRPRDYKRPNTKPHNLLFNNELTTDNPNYFEPVGLNKQKSVIVYANFLPPQAVSELGLDDYDERVYAAVGSCLFAGNQFIPFSMLYNRGVLGLSPKERGREITPNIEKDIITSLSKFDGRITITNDPTGELSKRDPDFKKEVINEPLLFYQIREETVHGQVTRGIAIPSGYIPVGYRYGELNGNEILTDRIESIHVDGLNYSRDNIIIANATYKRVKEIQYHNDQKRYSRELPENKRTITYEYIAQRVANEQSGSSTTEEKKVFASMSPTERNRLKKKIDSCMKSYQASGLFDRYEHKRDSTKSFYAVVIYFEEKTKKLNTHKSGS